MYDVSKFSVFTESGALSTGFASRVRSSSLVRSIPFVLLSVISWIVFVSRTSRNDPRNHTNYTKLITTFNRLLRQGPSDW